MMKRIAFVARVAAACIALAPLLAASLDAQRTEPVAKAPSTPLPRSAIVPVVVAPPAPKGVVVTGTQVIVTVVWQSVPGVASYVVIRRLNNNTVKQASLPATATRWIDVGTRPSTDYTYVVDAIYPDGRDAFTEVPFKTPLAENPRLVKATQVGAHQVQLTWEPVSGVSYYMVFGPGSNVGGMKVAPATSPSVLVMGVSAGLRVWNVGSYYDPDPQLWSSVGYSPYAGPRAFSTPGADFTAVRLTVIDPTAPAPPVVPSSSAPFGDNYQVVATGFRVNHQTFDDPLQLDGKGDEAYAAFMSFQFNLTTGRQVGDFQARVTPVFGDLNDQPPRSGRVNAGSASPAGGLVTGDVVPPGDPTQRYGRQVSSELFPFLIWRGPLIAGQDAVLILSTMWESDGNNDAYLQWHRDEVNSLARTWADPMVLQALKAKQLALVMPTSGSQTTVSLLKQDRPIGLQRSGPFLTLPRWAIVLTREMLDNAFAAAGGASIVRMQIPFVDAPGPDLQGSYVLYIDVERIR